MRTWTLLAILVLGCGAGPTRASETLAAPEVATGEAAPTAESPGTSDPCTATSAVEGQGDCDAYFEGAYVDRTTGRCVAGYASGCNATFPFDTVEACRARCEPRAETAPAVPASRLALAHRADDGRVFVELPEGGALVAPETSTPVCASPRCGFRLWTQPRPDDEGTRDPVFIVRPDGQLCAGHLGARVALGKLDPYQFEEPYEPRDATWSRGALADGCSAGDEPFLFAIFPAPGRSPEAGLLAGEPTPAARRAEQNARALHEGSARLQTTVWRFGQRHYVRARECAGSCGVHDDEEQFHVYDAEGLTLIDDPRFDDPDAVCCDLVTGLVDVNGDGEPEQIMREGYPEDAEWVWLRVDGPDVRWRAALPWE